MQKRTAFFGFISTTNMTLFVAVTKNGFHCGTNKGICLILYFFSFNIFTWRACSLNHYINHFSNYLKALFWHANFIKTVPSANWGVFRTPPLFSLFWISPTHRHCLKNILEGLDPVVCWILISFTIRPPVLCQRHQQCGSISFQKYNIYIYKQEGRMQSLQSTICKPPLD